MELGSSPTPPTPSYTELEYIESTGTQIINTEINPTINHEVEIDFQFTNKGNADLFGSREYWYSRGYMAGADGGVVGNTYYLQFGGTWVKQGTTDYLRHTLYFNQNNTGVVKVDNDVLTNNIKQNFSAYAPIYLFGHYDHEGGDHISYGTYKMYSCKIYESQVLIRDYIPVLDSNNVACLYDKVTETYLYNSGTGTFDYEILYTITTDTSIITVPTQAYAGDTITLVPVDNTKVIESFDLNGTTIYGDTFTMPSQNVTITNVGFVNCTKLIYIESTGTQYIDTNYYHKTGSTSYEMELAVVSLPNQYSTIFGARTSYNGRDAYYLGVQNNNVAYCCCGGSYYSALNWQLSMNTKYHVLFEHNVGITVDGTLKNGFTNAYSYTCNKTDYIFALNEGSVLEKINMKLYSFKIKEDNNLILDLVPVLDSNSTPCMYDKVSKTFFYNAGTGTFNYGTIQS
jgi:hypothetical protein